MWHQCAAKWGPWILVSGKNLDTWTSLPDANRTVGSEYRDDWNGRILTIRHSERDLNITFNPNSRLVRVEAGDGEMYFSPPEVSRRAACGWGSGASRSPITPSAPLTSGPPARWRPRC